MQHSVVASRYAKAFFDLAKEQGTEELHKASSVLMDFKEIVETFEEFSLLIKDPALTLDEKKKVLQVVLGKLNASPLIQQFFFLLLEKKRLVYISAIAMQFRDLIDQEDNVSRGLLTTAISIDANRQASIVETLEKQIGRKLELSFVVDPSLLGGTVLKIGDIVLDASIATQLNNLSQTITRGGGE